MRPPRLFEPPCDSSMPAFPSPGAKLTFLISPADISWAPDVLVQPDVFVTAIAEARTFDWQQIKTLLLAIEALSPSTSLPALEP